MAYAKIVKLTNTPNTNDPNYTVDEKRQIVEQTLAGPTLPDPNYDNGCIASFDVWALEKPDENVDDPQDAAKGYQRKTKGGILNPDVEFDSVKACVIRVNVRNGRAWVIDGWHRVLKARANGCTYILAYVTIDLPIEKEAEIFATQNEHTETVKPIEKYKASVVYGEPTALQVQTLCEKYRLIPSTKKFANDYRPLSSLTTCQNILGMSMGYDAMDWMLELMDKCHWLNMANATTSRYLSAFKNAYDIAVTSGRLKATTKRLKTIMKRTSPTMFQTKSVARYGGGDCRTTIKSLMEAIIDGTVTLSDYTAILAIDIDD